MLDFQDSTGIFQVDSNRTAWRSVGREAVVLDLPSSVYFGLNGSASALWPELLAGATFDHLVQTLISSTSDEINERQGAAEVAAFLNAVDEVGLLMPGTAHG